MSLPVVIGLISLLATLVVHTSALFYWAGQIRQMLRDHERRITSLERDDS